MRPIGESGGAHDEHVIAASGASKEKKWKRGPETEVPTTLTRVWRSETGRLSRLNLIKRTFNRLRNVNSPVPTVPSRGIVCAHSRDCLFKLN